MILITYFLVFENRQFKFIYQGYDIKLSIHLTGFSSPSILVDLHFNFSGATEDAAMFVLLSTICGNIIYMHEAQSCVACGLLTTRESSVKALISEKSRSQY